MTRLFSRPISASIGVLLLFLLSCSISVRLTAQENALEFDTGRPRPQKNGLPVLGSGLALSSGSFRGVPKGELAGWTVSLWFYANSASNSKGDLFSIVRNPANGDVIRLRFEKDGLSFYAARGKKKGRPGWKLETNNVTPQRWHHAAVSYAQETGPALYLDGQLVAQGQRGWLGYGTSFENYHFGEFSDGLIDDFSLHNRPLNANEIRSLFAGNEIDDGFIAFNDFEKVSHRDYAIFTESDRDEAYLDEGKKLYELHCIQCHSKDGVAPPPNPLSRIFTKHKMENGGDPLSMFRTVTFGFRNMMPAPQLEPSERYKVIHYIRERMIKERSPDLFEPLPSGYANTLPQDPGNSGEEAARVDALSRTGYLRDFGKALISPVQGKSPQNSSKNALTIDLGDETTISYDLGAMRSIGAWRGGFLNFHNTLHHKLRAPALPDTRSFDLISGTDSWRWAWNGKAENEAPDMAPLTVWPEEQIRYRGHYPFGDEIVISYTVQGRGVLESPLYEDGALHRRLTIAAGKNTLEAVVLSGLDSDPVIENSRVTAGSLTVHLQDPSGTAKWRFTNSKDLVLQVLPSDRPISLNVAVAANEASVRRQVADLQKRTEGASRRWTTQHEMRGKLAVSNFQGYALDSLPVPLKNEYNTWMRTSSLTFFPDGRLAVGTLSGDIWIVTGIDKSLERVTWQRFAAGLYEPLGLKVVDGVLTAITRGRIVKLHDYNGDGEADFYEAFHNERQPAPGWHAYSFDLEIGDDGSYYYARTGGFSEWAVPGGLVRVSPDGKTAEVLGVGMRVPNGIGKLPDGRITVGDNQGTYVPASKIVVASEPNSFLGAGKWDQREGNYDPEKIVDPIVYMPQELDSSCGSQLWVEKDQRFGPLSGRYFHTSYGRARTMYLILDDLGDILQGAVFSLPLPMESGTMRAAKNPVDGQLYFSGLTGWQAGATREGSIQRLRFTGEDGLYLIDAKARPGRVELTFSEPLASADTTSFEAEMWNYRWSRKYGSPHLKVSEPETEGADALEIGNGKFEDQGRKLVVPMPGLRPCHTLKLTFSVQGKNGAALAAPVYFTIHRLPE